MPYFTRMAERLTPYVELNLEECELTCDGVISLLQVLSSFKRPLNSLRIGDNNLGRLAFVLYYSIYVLVFYFNMCALQ